MNEEEVVSFQLDDRLIADFCEGAVMLMLSRDPRHDYWMGVAELTYAEVRALVEFLTKGLEEADAASGD